MNVALKQKNNVCEELFYELFIYKKHTLKMIEKVD